MNLNRASISCLLYVILIGVSCAHAWCNHWQPAIWLLFITSVTQNIINRYNIDQ